MDPHDYQETRQWGPVLSSMSANFQRDLQRGKLAEDEFAEKYPQLIRLDGYKGDFRTPSGLIVELKADSYSPHKWPNVIIERYSSGTKDGGPWQSRGHGADVYAYWFKNYDLLLLYPIDVLCQVVEELVMTHNIPLEEKDNGRYVTRFYRIKRDLLTSILQSEDVLK